METLGGAKTPLELTTFFHFLSGWVEFWGGGG